MRRSELVGLTVEHPQRRDDHWAIVDLIGRGGHIRIIPVPDWVKTTVDDWADVAGLKNGKLFMPSYRIFGAQYLSKGMASTFGGSDSVCRAA